MKVKTITLLCAFASAALPAFSIAQDKTPLELNRGVSMRKEVEHATSLAVASLAKMQKEDGSWGLPETPALTALPVLAYFMDPARDPDKDPIAPNIRKALEYIAGKAKEDGGIYVEGLGTYNTALCMLALHSSGDLAYRDIILKARRFITQQQQDFDKKGVADNAYDGGIGYGPGDRHTHSDMSNTHIALEALYYTKDLLADAPKPAEGEAELDWDAAIAFVERCQNLPETNKEEWASGDELNRGGFVYEPGDSKAGEVEVAGGKTALRSYGSMSYAGLLSFGYAEMDKDDQRVKAVKEWLGKNYSVEENPGMGTAGYFYYLNTMSKALAITGEKKFELVDGKSVHWANDVAKKLLATQKPDGTWVNENSRWWENDPMLTTSFAVLALARVHENL